MYTLEDLFDTYCVPEDQHTVFGTYLYPLVLFTSENFNDPGTDFSRSVEVIRTLRIGPHEIMVTRTGGLFARPQGQPSYSTLGATPSEDLQTKLLFVEALVDSLNLLTCELALSRKLQLVATVSKTVTNADICRGQLSGTGAVAVAGTLSNGFGRERVDSYMIALLDAVNRGSRCIWNRTQELVLDDIQKLECATRLAAISKSIPPLIIGAYASFSSQLFAEAIVDSWIATEQIVDYLWQEYISGLSAGERIKRLEDTRTYSVSVRLEVLLTAGVIKLELYEILHGGRKQRNDLVHRAQAGLSAAVECTHALRAAVEFVCNREVAVPSCMYGLGW